MLSIDEAREQWSPARPYLNTASYGLPPRAGFDALQTALADWRCGRTSWEHWGDSAEGARRAFAELVGAPRGRVAIGATASEFVGLVAASLPAGARVLVPDVEFTSTLFPFLVQERRGVRVTTPAPSQLAAAIDARTDLVAFSAVQMSTGDVADVEAIVAAAAHHGATTLVDATQACGWLPLHAMRFGALVCSAYKWLMAPRGTAFMVVGDDALLETVVPHSAGWYAGEDVHASYFGPPLRLARDARRFDTSPAWFSWVGAQPAIELVNRIGVAAVHDHDVGLANRFRAGLGMAPSDSAIVTVQMPDAAQRLARAGIAAAVRGGRLRVSCHVYNTAADVDAALDALASPAPAA